MTTRTQIPLRLLFSQTPIVPAVRNAEQLERALATPAKLVYVLAGDPESCAPTLSRITAAGKVPILNLDLMSGLSRDRHAVNFLRSCGARGIISTHLDALRHAHSQGMYAVQRTFLVDSGAVDAILTQLKNSPIDALEVLPALVAPKLLARVRPVAPELPVMGGGLLHTLKEVESLLEAGLSAVSVSNPQMWIC